MLNISKQITDLEDQYDFSICTLVTRENEYSEMIESFVEKGFTKDRCEYLHINNSSGKGLDAYKGLNLFLQTAKGKYIIICHQDILLLEHGYEHLTQKISEINLLDENWGILANAGGLNYKWVAVNITTGKGRVFKEAELPLKCSTIDENFFIVKKSANIALSNNLKGFHMYGTDICLIADILGYSSYVIDFHLLHKSDGNADAVFYQNKKQLIDKYNHAFRSRYMATTCTKLFISGSSATYWFFNSKLVKFFVRKYNKFFKKRDKYYLS